jgi:hypothetical protein
MATAKPKKDLNAFRALHDRNVVVPDKIKKGLEALKKSGDAWEYEGEFMKRAAISQTDLGAYRSQFDEHIVETKGKSGKRAWFYDKKAAAEMRAAIG